MNTTNFHTELQYKAVRSGGKGGQNVNKVATKVELRFDVVQSALLTEAQKARLLVNINTRLTEEGVLILTSGKERTQLNNKKRVTKRFYKILEKGLHQAKKRKPTAIPYGVKAARLKNKKFKSEKKKLRSINLFNY